VSYYHYMGATPLSIRFDDAVLSRLRRRAKASPGASTSGLVHRLVDEGLRMQEHPGVIFKDGPTGRRAALALGPDVWEVVKFLREIDERGSAAVDAAAEVLAVPASQVAAAIQYYGDYREEIDAEISEADDASVRAEQAWLATERLLA
jgi:hypothetical protein